MEKPTSVVQTFPKFKPIILMNPSSLHLNKRAPKYVGYIHLSRVRTLSNKLKRFKFIKKIEYGYREKSDIVQKCCLRHFKTLTESIDIDYSNYKTLVSRKISKSQLTLETCCFHYFTGPLDLYKNFFTKNYVQNISFDFKDWNYSNKQSNSIIRGIRRLTRLKGIKRINIVFRSLSANGNILKFVHNVLLSVRPEVKVELILTSFPPSELDIPSVITFHSLNNIVRRLVYVDLYCKVNSPTDSKILIQFVASLKRLVTLKLNIEGNRKVVNSLVDTCPLIFENNLALETLSFIVGYHELFISSKIETLKFGKILMNYQRFFSALKIIEIGLPNYIISFQGLDAKPELNLFPHAQRVGLNGLIASWEGFKYFIQGVKPYQFRGSELNLTLKPYKLTDTNPLFKALATEIKVESLAIYRMNRYLPVHINCNIFIGFLNKIKGPKVLSMEVSGSKVVLKDLDHESIVEAWESLNKRMDLPRFEIDCPKDKTSLVFDRRRFDELKKYGEISQKKEKCNLF